MALTPGTRLGPYEVVAPLGEGGMGLVYRATDTRLGRTVAIKVSRDEFSARFEREARAVAALNHPHICQLYDVGPNYLVMEFVDGVPIQPPGDATRLVTLASQIAEALVAAHAAGIVHRDLKPDNILITKDGQVKVLDFGLATGGTEAGVLDALVTQAATAVGTTVGTVAYMSPEQARGEAVDTRSDLWSLGVVLYELATGGRPFGGATPAVVFERILNQTPPALRESGVHVPAGLSPIVAKLLEKDRARRYQSAADARADLTRLAQAAPESRRAEPSPSIAVLPFANLSADPENEYFGDGLAEEILNALAGINGLKVIARTSAFAFRGKADDVRKIADALGVATVLEGSVRRAGSRIRVTAQLIDAMSGSQLWSERFDREMIDVFAVQDEIARAIVGTIAPTLGGAVASASPTVNIEAYEAYLKGRYAFFTLTPEGVSRGRAEYEKAIALDPRFAPAHAGLAGYFVLPAETGQAAASETMPRAKAKAAPYLAQLDTFEFALLRDVGLAVFHMVRANFVEAAVCLGKAIDKRNPWASLSATWLIAGFAESESGRAIKKRINLV